MSEKCPKCGKFHPPASAEQREAMRLAKSLSEMLMKAAIDAINAVQQVRPQFEFLPIIIMNVAGEDGGLQATTCEFPGTYDREQIADLVRTASLFIEKGSGNVAGAMVSEEVVSDEPTKH